MKREALFAATALAVTGRIALAQGGDDPMAQFRACSLMERADRLECLDKLSRTVAPVMPSPSKENHWVISQTRSPVDYAPIATATISSSELGGGDALALSIRCRGGRTEIAVVGPAVSGRGEDYAISYRVNNGQPVQIAATAPMFGTGVAFHVEAASLIQSLPGEGELIVRLSPHVGAALNGRFSLAGFIPTRTKIAATCRWPHAIARPNN